MTHNVKLLATATIFADAHVLLVRYSNMPDRQQGWFLPHVLLEAFEHPADGISRALRDQLALDASGVSLKYVESFKGRDGTWHLPFHFLLNLPTRPTIKPSSELAATDWFALDKLPSASEVAHHGWALDTIQAIRP